MSSAVDVAEEILRQRGPLDTYSLQKLVYYCQAYHLVKRDHPLFGEPIQAWTDGPAVPVLFDRHRGRRSVKTVDGDPSRLSREAQDSISHVLQFYGDHDSSWLVNQTHIDSPWADVREGLRPNATSSLPITHEAMRDFYAPVFNDPDVDEALALAERGEGITLEEMRELYGV